MNKATNWIAAAAVAVLLAGSASAGINQQETPPAPPAAEETPKAPKPPKPAKPRTPAPVPMVWGVSGGSGSYLGIDTRDITAERKQALSLPEERGVEVTLVDKDAPAGKAGLQERDVIMEFNGEKVLSVEHLKRLIRETPPGRTVTLGIIRGGQPSQVQATLADRAKVEREARVWRRAPRARVVVPEVDMEEFDFEMPEMPEIDVRVIRAATTGLVVENLTPQLGEFFGVPGGEGLLVKSIEKGSAAETAGFRAGDVIVKAGNERVTNRTTWRAALRNQRRTGGAMPVVVIREKREVTLNLKLSEPRGEVKEGNLLLDREDLEEALVAAEPLAIEAAKVAMLAVPERIDIELAEEMAEVAADAAEAAEDTLIEVEPALPRSECPNRL